MPSPRRNADYNNSSVAQITDYFANSNTRFVYDLADRVVSQREYSGTNKNGGELLSYTDFTYADKTNYLTGIKHFSPLGTQTIGYTYGNLKRGYMPDQVYGVSWNGTNKLQNYYDGLGRLVRKSYNGIESFGMVYTYEDITVNNDQRTTTLVKSVETPTGTYTYTYDKLGNITSVTDGTYTTSYEYDSLNQLTRVNDEKAGKTYTYSYTNGNITSQSEYPYTVGVDALIDPNNTKTWEYNDSTWSDLLTNYNGTPITYDEIGNPLTIGEKSLTWTGRQLQSITDNENAISYTYNGDGLRTSKTVNGETTNYYYNGSILAGQKSGNDTLVFMYDNNSDIFGFIYNDTEYYYIKNAQNDVIAIADKDGKVALKYSYDAWGKVISITDKDGNPIDDSVGNGVLDVPSNTSEPTTADETTTVDESVSLTTVDPQIAQLARINPILYRSYYYDKETEWYYLNSRFYNPEFCRFINSDDSDIIDGGNDHILENNLFTYCFNNPINLTDDDGTWPSWATKVAIGAAVIAAAAIVTIATGGAGAGVAGFIAAGVLKGAAIGGAIGAATGAAGGAISHRVSTGSWQGAGNAALEGGASGFMSGAITGAITGGISRSVQVVKAAKCWDPGTGKSGYSSMKYHYNKHAVKDGFSKNNNVVKYTKDALNFSYKNKSAFKLTYNYKYKNASWFLQYKPGRGGYYTSAGKILTFWYKYRSRK